jgi:hypothetical protein
MNATFIVKIEKCDGVTVRHCCCQKLTLDPGTVHQFMHPPFVKRDLMLLPTLCLVIEKLKNIQKIAKNPKKNPINN